MDLRAPTVTVEEDERGEDGRFLRIVVRSLRRAAGIQLRIELQGVIQEVTVADRPMSANLSGSFSLTYLAPPETGLRLGLRVDVDTPVSVWVGDFSWDLPALETLPDRPPDRMPATPDWTFVHRTLTL